MDDKRLDRIEAKLDKLTDAVTAIARVEEKTHAMTKRVDAIETRVARTEDDLTNIAIIARKNSGVARFADKAFWLIVGGVLAVITFIFKE